MAAPRIKLFFENGALGQVAAGSDRVFGLLTTGVAVPSTFALATPYILRGLDSLTALGVNATNNASLYKTLTEFYAEAGNGTELWIMCFPDTVKLSDMVDTTDATKAKALINAANGRLHGLFVSRTPGVGYTPTIADGMDADVELAKTNAKVLRTWAIDSKFAPVFVIIEGYAYSSTPVDLNDLTTENKSGVSVMIGDTVVNAKQAAMGLLAGRLAKNAIHINIGQVADGPVASNTAFIGATAVEKADWESLHEKGYITFRTHVGRSGYFFNDDPCAALPTDDYNHLTAIRTIDKASRIAYDVMLSKLLRPVAVNANGSMQAVMAKAWELDVVRAVSNAMTANGELSADPTNPNDRGVTCFIDPAQIVTGTNRVWVKIRIRPFGYARFIDVYLGFQVVSA